MRHCVFQLSLKFILVGRIFIIFLSFLRQRKHFLLALLALELAVVFIVGSLTVRGVWDGGSCECLLFIMLVGRACEARVGLGLLVYMVRVYGNDGIRSLSVHKP